MTPLRRWSLASRLTIGLTVVIIAGGLTTAGVALLVGPQVFHEHLVMAGLGDDPTVLAHVEEAYAASSLLSIVPVTVLIIAVSGWVVWLATRPLRRALTELTQAASVVSRGEHPDPLPERHAGADLDTLTHAFNAMAADLADSERARQRLLADLAHELRTPVATLRAWTESLQDGVTTWGPDAAGVLTAQGDRLNRLARDLQDISLADEHRLVLERQPQTVGGVVADAVAAISPTAQAAGVIVASAVEPDIESRAIEVDAARIGQILGNLLGNALRHTPAGGQVWVRASQAPKAVAITVSDSGGGIPESELPLVFDRFYRGSVAAARDGRGSGLGLTISRALAQAHGGELTAANDGRGAVFTLTIPC